MMESPVLLLGFNRPDYFQQVFNKIKKNRPKRLYIAIDGPRPSFCDDAEKCKDCCQMVNQIDWDCDIHTLFREANLGCGLGVSGAISWAFENEDRLIILEDDCVPSDSFFPYCDMMLERYKDDTRVWQVAGRSYHPNSRFFDQSDYIFSHYPHVWGWATWKRCWDQYDFYMSDFQDYLSGGGALNTSISERFGKIENRYLGKVYDEIHSEGHYHTWDFQWSYLMLKNNGYSIVPRKNLIHNIGNIGTHTSANAKQDIPSEEISMDLKHPLFVIPNREYDIYHGRKVVYPRPNLFLQLAVKLKHLIMR